MELPQHAPAQAPAQLIRIDDGLVLRPFDAEADLAVWLRVIEESLEHLRPWMPWVAEHSPSRAADFLARRAELWEAGAEFTYAVVADGAIVGTCGLYRHEDTPEGAREIGYWLHPAATGRGVASRAAGALVEEGFRLPGVDELLIVHDLGNHASGAVAARLGFADHDVSDGLRTWRLARTTHP
ncbi:GNAT family N-acetyltransferase [Streptomyces showdoensis]|uniref:Acetyltransferase n=1 Tax=Streptomyces showdoensis TaxID=68268 RepID=A0A2P2GT18_STREW|nr:GNAT family N-acetyltransferase [Streptomyces showdoensis]KKZ74633.1 acetyltransferase [Streptomyces showdoensis]